MHAEDVTYRVVFAPVFVGRYAFSGRGHTFLCNAQSATTWGERPLGFGSIPRAIGKLLTGGAAAAVPTVTICSGTELNARDSVDHYAKDHRFLVLPPSDQFLITSAVGWADVQNTGDSEVVLQAHWRGNRTAPGPSRSLKPGQRISFSFKGLWAIEVVSGDANQIKVHRIETRDGSEKLDWLGMAEPPTSSI